MPPRRAAAPSLALALVAATLAACVPAPVAVAPPAAPPISAAPAPTPGRTAALFDDPALARRYAEGVITPELLASHLYTLADDGFEGRETSARGQRLAAVYLAGQYRRLGLTPLGSGSADSLYGPIPGDARTPRRYMQPFRVYGQRLHRAALTATRGGQTVAEATFGPGQTNRDALPVFATVAGADGGAVFLGYGIADSTAGYDDLAALRRARVSLQGKWALVLAGEPTDAAGRSRLTRDGAPSRWTTDPMAKLRALLPLGVAGVLVVSDLGADGPAFASRVAAAAVQSQQAVGNLSLRPPSGTPTARRGFPPIYAVSSAFADRLLGAENQTTAGLARRIAADRRPVVLELPGVTVANPYERRPFVATTENVAALLEGSDPALRDEVVVISSHYDHIGVNAGLPGADVINNGADDDGSGTVSVLALAEAFARAKAEGRGPRRSILFLNVTGEEKGLLGSAYYADVEPLVPLAKTVANLNMDMVGRFDPTEPARSENYVYVIGSNLISRELDAINTRANREIGANLELSQRFNTRDDPNQFYRRSDHWNFGKNGIPFIFYFTGTHPDYHGVGDEPHKIAYDRMARIGRLVFATAWQVANQDARPAVSGTGFN